MPLRLFDSFGVRLNQGRVITHQHAPLSLYLWVASRHSVAASGSSRCNSRVKASCAGGSAASGCTRKDYSTVESTGVV